MSRKLLPCFECDTPTVGRHHVVPRSRGGKRTLSLCSQCHGLVHEREITASALVREGLRRARERGTVLGRAPWGFVWADGRHVPDPAKLAQARVLLALRDEGRTVRACVLHSGARMSVSTALNVIANRARYE